MESAFLTSLFDWLQAHPVIALALVFITAFGESLAFVGIIVPGAVLMMAFGALVALDVMPLGATLLTAVFGAIVGDSLSYWLGAHYQARLREFWPFSRYPDLLARGESFFHRHGGKSVLFGRFFGPVRAVVPAVAGMLGMPPRRFLVVNILSALLWAPVYLLPGLIFGSSLQLASEFAGRFAVLVVGLLAMLLLTGWLIRQAYLWLRPLTLTAMARLLAWSRRHPLVGEIPAAIVSPTHPELRGLTMLALILLCALLGFLAIAHWQDQVSWIRNLNLLVYNGLQALHSPPADAAMRFLAGLSDIRLLALFTAFTGFLLWHQRAHLALGHWLAAFGVPLLLAAVARHFGHFGGPAPIPAIFDPGGQLMLAVSVYGFLAILVARGTPASWHLPIYLLAILLLLLVTFAPLYQGQLWLSDTLALLLLGTAWTALLGIAYRRHAQRDPFDRYHGRWLSLGLGLLLLWPLINPPPPTASQPAERYLMQLDAWQTSGWQLLPAVRADLRGDGRYVFNLQWAANEAVIATQLHELGWQRADRTHQRYLNWLNPLATAAELPLLPQVHAGRYDDLRYRFPHDDQSLWVIRLWRSDFALKTNAGILPLWYGQLARMRRVQRFGLNYLVTDPDAAAALHYWQQRTPLFAQARQVDRQPPLLLLLQPEATALPGGQ